MIQRALVEQSQAEALEEQAADGDVVLGEAGSMLRVCVLHSGGKRGRETSLLAP